jgi:hypothetical protein
VSCDNLRFLNAKAPDRFKFTDLVVPSLCTSKTAYPFAPLIEPDRVYELGAASAGAEEGARRNATNKNPGKIIFGNSFSFMTGSLKS